MRGRVRLSSDASEIKLVFSIPPHRPTPNTAPSWNINLHDRPSTVRWVTLAKKMLIRRPLWKIEQ